MGSSPPRRCASICFALAFLPLKIKESFLVIYNVLTLNYSEVSKRAINNPFKVQKRLSCMIQINPAV